MALYKGFFPNWLRLGPWNIIVSFNCLIVFVYTLFNASVGTTIFIFPSESSASLTLPLPVFWGGVMSALDGGTGRGLAF